MAKGIFFIILGALTLLAAIYLPVPFNGFIANWFYGFGFYNFCSTNINWSQLFNDIYSKSQIT